MADNIEQTKQELDLQRQINEERTKGINYGAKGIDQLKSKVKIMELLQKAQRAGVNSADDTKRALEDMVKLSGEWGDNIESLLRPMKQIRKEAVDTYRDELKAIKEKEKATNKVLNKERRQVRAKMMAKMEVTLPEERKQRMQAVRKGEAPIGMGRDIKTMLGKGTSFEGMKGAVQSLKDYMKAAKDVSGSTSGMTAMLGALGKTMTSFVKGNWIILLIMGAKMLVDTLMEWNKWTRELNKTFLKMAGPMGAVKNVRGEMKKFNDAIFDIGRNMRLGLKSEQIQAMFGAMSGAGMSLQGVGQRVGDYGKAIENARTISLQFGISLDEAGEHMSSQMLNLRSNVDDVRKSFDAMSYDAALAGISSQKFYQIVDGASSSLSYFGNFLKYTSGQLRDMVKGGVMGFKDASEHMTNMSQIFKNMSLQQRRAAVLMIGKKNVVSMFTQLENATQKRVNQQEGLIKAKIDEIDKQEKLAGTAGKGSAEAGEKAKLLRAELEIEMRKRENIKNDIRRMQQIRKTGDISQMAANLPMLTRNIQGAMIDALDNVKIDIFKQPTAAFEYLTQQFGMSLDDAQKFMDRAATTAMGITEFAKTWGTEFETVRKGNDDIFGKINSMLTNFGTTSGYQTYEDLDKALRGQLETAGASTQMIEEFILQTHKALPAMIGATKEGIGFLADAEGLSLKSIAGAGKLDLRAEADPEAQKQMIEQTTSIQDYLDIGADSVKYALANSDTTEKMNALMALGVQKIFGIFKWVQQIANFLSKGKKADLDKEIAFQKKDYISPQVKTMMQLRDKGLQLLQSSSEEDRKLGKKKLAEADKIDADIEKRISDHEDISASLSAVKEQEMMAAKKYIDQQRSAEDENKKLQADKSETEKQIQDISSAGSVVTEESKNKLEVLNDKLSKIADSISKNDKLISESKTQLGAFDIKKREEAKEEAEAKGTKSKLGKAHGKKAPKLEGEKVEIVGNRKKVYDLSGKLIRTEKWNPPEDEKPKTEVPVAATPTGVGATPTQAPAMTQAATAAPSSYVEQNANKAFTQTAAGAKSGFAWSGNAVFNFKDTTLDEDSLTKLSNVWDQWWNKKTSESQVRK